MLFLLLLTLVSPIWCLDNGLARTPPMGWLSWLAFGCNVDCDQQPNKCLNEALIKRTADRMVSDGFLAAGYQYVVIDDCWLEKNRSAHGRMVPDRKRFPSGMKALADYIHSKGLKFGMYQDIGTHTCESYPGMKGHEKIDVETFVGWEVDYLKIDGCYMDYKEMDTAYPAFGKLLNESGRPIVYSCSWPAYQEDVMTPNYKEIAKHCNLWRNYGDIEANWQSLLKIFDYYGGKPELAKYAGPGHFNDPDMLVIGNPGKGMNSFTEVTQMLVWAVLAAPLFISADLDELEPWSKDILLQKQFIEINQDPLGIPGKRISQDRDVDMWRRPLSNKKYIMIAYRRYEIPEFQDADLEFSFDEFQIPPNTYHVKDLVNGEDPFIYEIGNSKLFTLKNGVAGYLLTQVKKKDADKI